MASSPSAPRTRLIVTFSHWSIRAFSFAIPKVGEARAIRSPHRNNGAYWEVDRGGARRAAGVCISSGPFEPVTNCPFQNSLVSDSRFLGDSLGLLQIGDGQPDGNRASGFLLCLR